MTPALIPATGMVVPDTGTTNACPNHQPAGLAGTLFTPVQQRVLGFLFGQPGRRFQSAELIRLANAGTGAAHRFLQRLASCGLVQVENVGRQKFYQANPAAPIHKELVAIVRKTIGLRDPLGKALVPLADDIECAFVFGSVATGQGRANSDIDLMVIARSVDYTTLFDALRTAEQSLSGARIPVTRQGEGTQSLAVLLLFGAFLRSQLSGLDPNAEAITALEEPEAHLHPSATRALMHVVGDLPGQKLISTHSGHLLSSVSAKAIRRLAYEGGEVKAYRIDWDSLTAEERRKFDSHVRRTRGELIFARCWLLVEGETEVIVMTGAAEALGLNLDRVGVCCVEYSQAGVEMLAKVANQLGIAWYCVADNDDAGRGYVRSVRRELGSTPESDRVAISYENMEQLLCESGFGHLYESHISTQKDPPTAERDTKEYWRQVIKAGSGSKPGVAAEAVEWMTRHDDPTPVPAPVEAILNKAVELAEAS